MSFWQQFSDKIVDVTNYVQERVTGDASTAEYYNPCGTDENALDHEADDNYAAPRFESKHVGEARLDRAFDVVSDLTKKYTGLEIPDVLASDIAPASNSRRTTTNPMAKDLATDLSKTNTPSNNNNHLPPSLQNSLRNLENLNTNSNNNSGQNSNQKSNTNSNQTQTSSNQNSNYSTPAPSKTPGELTFVFHNSMTDTDERVMHESDKDPRRPIDEVPYTISINGSKLSERLKFPKSLQFDAFISSSISYLNYGDLLECVADQEKSHWVMWLGKDINGIGQVIHFRKRFKTIKVESLASACNDKSIRRVNNHFPGYQACEIEKIKAAVNSVVSQNANRFAQNFESSELFVSWLRYQQDDFLNKKMVKQDFKLKVYLETDGKPVVESFGSLTEAVTSLRYKQKEGKQFLIESKTNLLTF